MVGHDQGIGAALNGKLGILSIEDALENELAAPALFDALDVIPTEGGVELLGGPCRQCACIFDALSVADDVAEGAPLGAEHTHPPARLAGDVDDIAEGHPRRRAEAILHVLVTLSEDLQIEGEHQGRASRRLGAADQAIDEITIAHDVELKPERLVGVLRHVLDRADAHGGKRKGNARCRGGTRGQQLTVRVLHAGETDGGQRHRHGDRLANHTGGEGAV